ncbi:odorant receptor 131-2-like [Coregonus clupeaformis]|uniref:odorant receptor 131-2-like n=1 Tax=Coregonus clupeaformis TaxID=59861 RepID=UPI001E1C3A21|nr:odorant receptor 131-2-like [Coregonus clupeaformis]
MPNTSQGSEGSEGSFELPTVQYQRPLNDKVVIVQVLIGIFLYINFLMIVTFFKKEAFFTNTRYIFFAHTLVCDSMFLVLTDVLLLMSYSRVTMPGGLCIFLIVIIENLNFATPLTLTAMSLERYVAICMPLRHSELSTPVRAMHCILLIQALSSIEWIIVISILFSAVPLRFYTSPLVCSFEQIIVFSWQGHVSSALCQFYFLVMSVVIAFTYVKIMVAARHASSDSNKSTNKGLRTVILHSLQLLLCLIQFWCPMIELAIMKINFNVFIHLRYIDYIIFILAPRCLSPLVYGLRDKDFLVVMKYYALFGYSKKVFIFNMDKPNRKKKKKNPMHTCKVNAGNV